MKRPRFNNDWPPSVKQLYKHDMEEYWDKSLVPNKWNQYRNLLNNYLSLVTDSQKLEILDIGCAQATLALLLAEQGHKVTAVDLRQESLDYAKSRYEKGEIEFIQQNVLEAKLDKSYDLVFANQLIEHLVYPEKMINTLKQMLKPGGKLVVATPNHAYAMCNLPTFSELGNPKDWEEKQFTADGDGHFFAYTQKELESIFDKCGIQNVKSRLFETPFISGHMKFRYLHKFLPFSVLKLFDAMSLAFPFIRKRFSHQIVISGTVAASNAVYNSKEP